MITNTIEKNVNIATLGCYGIVAVTGLLAGAVTALTMGSACATGYLLASLVSAISFLVMKKMKVSKDLEDSVTSLQSENNTLKEVNDNFQELNGDLKANNEKLEEIKNDLENDINIVSESVKLVGESTSEFMTKLKRTHERLKSENDRHQQLNRQQGMFQIMQLFKDFDSNADFTLSANELRMNEHYLKKMFPNSRFEVPGTDSVMTFEELVNFLLPIDSALEKV